MVIYFAHRGSMTEAPENTLPSFQRALKSGALALELDVQLTKDGQLIVCHDQRIDRVAAQADGYIKDYTLEEIKNIDVGSSFSEEFAGVSLATLDEVLDICPADILVNVEIKNIPILYKGIEEKLIDCLTAHDRLEHSMISSLDHIALKRVKQLVPSTRVGLLFRDRFIEEWNYATNCGIDVYSLHPRYTFVDKEFVAKSHEAGFKVYPWTVNSVYDLKWLENYGVDGVFTNNPQIFGVNQTE